MEFTGHSRMFRSRKWVLSTPTLWIWLYFLDVILLRSGDRFPVWWDFPHRSRPALGPTQPRVQWVLGFFREGKAAGAWRPPAPTSTGVKGRVELYLYCPSGASWFVLRLTLPLILLNGEEKTVMCNCSYSYNACVMVLKLYFRKTFRFQCKK